MSKNILFLLMLFLPAYANAGVGIGAVVLKEVRVENGNVYLFTENSPSNPLNCDLANPIKLVPADAGFDHMYSSALTALTTGKKLKLWLRSCVNSPWAKTIPKAYATGLLAE
jgi:hypothetical protein